MYADLIRVNLRDLREFFFPIINSKPDLIFFARIILEKMLGKVVKHSNIVYSKQYWIWQPTPQNRIKRDLYLRDSLFRSFVTSLFFLWGFAHGCLDVLNKIFSGVASYVES